MGLADARPYGVKEMAKTFPVEKATVLSILNLKSEVDDNGVMAVHEPTVMLWFKQYVDADEPAVPAVPLAYNA